VEEKSMIDNSSAIRRFIGMAWVAIVMIGAGRPSPIAAQDLSPIVDANNITIGNRSDNTIHLWQGADADSNSAGAKILRMQPTVAQSDANLPTVGTNALMPTDIQPDGASQSMQFGASPGVGSASDNQFGLCADWPGGPKVAVIDPSHIGGAPKLSPYLNAQDPAHPQSMIDFIQLLRVDSIAATMTANDTVKDAVGGQSGFFSCARLGLHDEYWRIESGIGIAWTTVLDRSKPLMDYANRESVVWNLSLLYFPFGDYRWRPFVLLGTGISELNTLAKNSQGNSATVYTGISHKN
jgi:hypothetical protein